MFVASCALLLAAANGLYAPATRHPLARAAKPLQAAKEGVAAASEKQRIARRSVVKSIQVNIYIQIHAYTQKNAQQFDPHARRAPFPRRRRNGKHTQVVVGNGMVGQRLVELCADKLAERGASDQVDIVSFCEERLAAYNRVRLTSWFETRDADDLSLVGSYKDAPQGEWYASEERPNCKVRVGDRATGLDVDKKEF